MTTLPYLLTVSLYLLLFYSCYGVFLRRNTFFGLNRTYLLSSIGLSLLLPLIRLPEETIGTLPVSSITLPTFVIGNSPAIENDTWSIRQWCWLAYSVGVAGMLVRFGLNLRAVFRLIKRGTIEPKRLYSLVRLPDNRAPSFSFGRYLVLNHTDSLTEPDALLRHEEAHIQQYHTADILFLESMQVIFWFNPMIWLYKRALQEVHEFLADQAVLKIPQPDYPHQLVAYALNVSPSSLITPFVSNSTLKQRIIMLQKPASHRRSLLGYVLALPLAALLSLCTQSERDQPQTEADQARLVTPARVVNVDGEVLTVVEQQPEFQGGMAGLGNYIHKNLTYPAAAQKANAHGKVFVNFIVTKTGEITDVRLLKGIGFGADEEAIRVVKSMPRWKPAVHNGQVVNIRYNLPINFQLEEDATSETKAGIPPAQTTKKSAFFAVPTDDTDIEKAYKHFIVNNKEVAFNDFKRYSKADIVEASSSQQLIRIETN